MDLNALSVRQLVDLGCALNGGTFGRDPARMNKLAIMAHVRDLASPDVVESVAANILAGQPARSVQSTSLGDADATGAASAPEVRIDLDEDEAAAVAAVRAAKAKRLATVAAGLTEAEVRLICADMILAAPRVGSAEKAAAIPLDLSGVGGAPSVDITGKHPLFPLVLALAALPHALRPNVLLVGPAGCGKSTLAHHVAQALQRPFCAISLSPGVTEAALGARILPIHEGGRFGAVDSEFLRLYRVPSVVLLDEMDAADPSVLVAANAAIGNGGFNVEARAVDGQETWVERSELNVILAAANTYGTGATALYVGRGALDASTTDRFLLLEMEYDTTLEARIMGYPCDAAPSWVPSASTDAKQVSIDLVDLLAWVKNVRERVASSGMRRVVSTRMLQKAVALRAVGCSIEETKERLLTGWTADERATIGYVRQSVRAHEVTPHHVDVPGDSHNTHGMHCPDCGSNMVLRRATKGKNAGNSFYGCAAYPKCRGIREVA